MRPSELHRTIRAASVALFLLLPGATSARATEPGEAVQASIGLADRQLPLPGGTWIVAGRGVQAATGDATGPYGVVQTRILLLRSGERVTAVAEFNTNEISVSDGWNEPGACEAVPAEHRLIRYRSRLDGACVFVEQTRIAPAGPPAWRQALSFVASHDLRLPETMLTAAFLVHDRQDMVDARLHFDPVDAGSPDALLAWAAEFAPRFEQGLANQLSGPPLDGPARAALLSDTPVLDRRLLELETLRRAGTIGPAEAEAQQQAALTEQPRSAEAAGGSAEMDGWYYRISTPLINLVTAYSVTQSAPLAVAIALTEHVAHSLVYAATQAGWENATWQASEHRTPWPAIEHVGDAPRLVAGPGS